MAISVVAASDSCNIRAKSRQHRSHSPAPSRLMAMAVSRSIVAKAQGSVCKECQQEGKAMERILTLASLLHGLKETGGLPQSPHNPFFAHRGEHIKKTSPGSLPRNSSPSAVDENSRLNVQLGSQPTDGLFY